MPGRSVSFQRACLLQVLEEQGGLRAVCERPVFFDEKGVAKEKSESWNVVRV